MKLSHFSSQPIDAMHPVVQDGRGPGVYKPKGLWVSVDGPDDWAEWCRSESFSDLDREFHYSVELVATANILHLKSPEEVISFTKKYFGEDESFPRHLRSLRAGKGIVWKHVAEDYSGIIIAPYQWPCRLLEETFWYYPWDCASGCVWDAGAVEKLELIRGPIKAEEAA